jgi:F0F1-type ATP synthase assembly protein I
VSGASNDRRPSMADAMRWVHQITSIALEMALPPLLGYFADERWKTGPWLVVVGAFLGFALAMVQLLNLAKQSSRSNPSQPRGGKGQAENDVTNREAGTGRGGT